MLATKNSGNLILYVKETFCFMALALICILTLFSFPVLSQYKEQKFDCRPIVAVAITKSEKGDGARRYSPDAVAKDLAEHLSNRENGGGENGVNAIPIFDVRLEKESEETKRLLREHTKTTTNADYLLFVEFKAILGGKWGKFIPGRSQSPTYSKFEVYYTLEEIGGNKELIGKEKDKRGRFKDSSHGDAYREIFSQISEDLIKTIKYAQASPGTVPSWERIERRHQCFVGSIKNFSNLTLEFDIEESGRERISVNFYTKGDKWRFEVKSAEFRQQLVMGFDGREEWIDGGSGSTSSNLPTAAKGFKNSLLDAADNAWKEEIVPTRVKVIGRDTVDNKSCFLVETGTRDGGLLKLYFDISTGALAKTVKFDRQRKLENELWFGEYREIARGKGVRFPYTLRTKNQDGTFTIELIKVGFDGSDISDSFFRPLRR